MASSSHAFVIRGIYSPEEEESPEFRGRVPAFDTADACRAWVSANDACTNPSYAACRQIFTHACDWPQVESLLLAPLARLRASGPPAPPPPLPAGNVFAAEAAVRAAITARLDLPFHAQTSEESTLNTLRYLFVHMRCGIFVAFRGGQLRLFVPFVNSAYTNTWGGALETDEAGGIAAYEEAKRGVLADLRKNASKEVFIADPTKWWANGNIMCNVASPHFWSDHYLAQLKHMLLALAAQRAVPDVEFFINKRDFPQLKRDASEPYDFLFTEDSQPLARESYSTYAPIASFFVGADFADLPLVCTDDWETATGLVFPPAATDLRSAAKRAEHDVPWEARTATAFFRGNSTGPGTDARTNQRIALAARSLEWARDGSGMGADNPTGDGVPCLDAGLVGWNLRDRKLQGAPMTYIKPHDLGIPLVAKVPMYAQARYKYQLYVEGQCVAALRALSSAQ
jgi:hypothetical protein